MIPCSSKEHETRIYCLMVPILEKRHDDRIELSERPEESERNKKAIDFIAAGNKHLYLIEHTFIESHPGRKRDDVQFYDLLGALEKNLHKKLSSPGFYFRFGIKMGAARGAKATKQIQERLQTWVYEKKDHLQPEKVISEIPAGVPFAVWLSKHKAVTAEIEGRFLIHRISPETEVIEKLRRERIGSAFEKKFPKLHTAKTQNAKSRSILILESNDIALSNHHLISEAVVDELKKRQDIPDDIYLIEMEIKKRPTVWILKEKEKLFAQIEDRGPHYLHDR